ncbi:MAG: MFS transporter, partial [Ktedonobacterales bacterium]|nr:MFS transporter [Ktedonobacterales bacterium]
MAQFSSSDALAASAPAGGRATPIPRRWWALVATSIGLFMALLDVTIVNVALPTIGDNLHASFADLQWVINAYALALAVLLVTAGRLGDI